VGAIALVTKISRWLLVGGVGAGLYNLSVIVKDSGEPAPID